MANKARNLAKAPANGPTHAVGNGELTQLLRLLDTVERSGINSVRKLKMFIKFAQNEGISMSELAGRARTRTYTEIQQAVIELSAGRYNAIKTPNLITLGHSQSEKPGHGRRKPIKLTPKGRRLFSRISEFCTR